MKEEIPMSEDEDSQREQEEQQRWESLTDEERRTLSACDDVRKDFERLLLDPAFKAEYEREMSKL